MPELRGLECSRCGRRAPSVVINSCPMCFTVVCLKCAHFAYGRYFCSSRCAQYFFHGDAEDEDDPGES